MVAEIAARGRCDDVAKVNALGLELSYCACYCFLSLNEVKMMMDLLCAWVQILEWLDQKQIHDKDH